MQRTVIGRGRWPRFRLVDSRLILVPAVLSLMTSACSVSPNGYAYNVRTEGAPVLNRDDKGKSLSVVVRIYQLRDASEFSRLTYDLLAQGRPEAQLLGPALIDKTDVVVVPGSAYVSPGQLHNETRYVGVVGFFRNPDPFYWRQLVPAEAVRSKGLIIRASDCFLTLGEVEPLALPGWSPNLQPQCGGSYASTTAGRRTAPLAAQPAAQPAPQNPGGLQTIPIYSSPGVVSTSPGYQAPAQGHPAAQPAAGYPQPNQGYQPAQGYQQAPNQGYQAAQPAQGYQAAQPAQGYQAAQPAPGYQAAQPQGYPAAPAAAPQGQSQSSSWWPQGMPTVNINANTPIAPAQVQIGAGGVGAVNVGAQPQPQPYYGQPAQPYYGQQAQPVYGQQPGYYPTQQQPYYGQPQYQNNSQPVYYGPQ